MACKYIELARERQARDLAQQGKSHFPYRFDESAAARACEFFPDMLRHWKGPLSGKRFDLSLWQSDDIIGPVFGWKRLDGTRRFRTVWIELPRKNGKSTMGAGAAYLLTMEENGGETYSVATKKDQARIIWESARKMLTLSPGLQQIFKGFAHSITCPPRSSFFKALGADSDTMDGLNPSAVLADEIHAWKDRHVWDVMETGMVGRTQAMMMALTTAGKCLETSIGWELHEHACSVLDGAVNDEEMFAFIAHADKGDDYESPDVWAKANPNLGVSVFEDRIAKSLEKAKRSPAFFNTWLRYHLNLWTDEAERAIPLERWTANKRKLPDLRGAECIGGLDLSAKIDLTAFVLLFPPGDYGKGWKGVWIAKPYFWLPEIRLEEEKRLPYRAWAQDGHVEITPGSIVDYNAVQRRMKDLGRKYRIKEIGFDPWNAYETASKLSEHGFRMVEVQQVYKNLSEPTKELMGLVKGKKLAHAGNPVLAWNARNLVLREDDNGNVAPSKKRSPEKIDGIAALVTAMSRATRVESSVYDTRGLRTLG